MSVMRIVPSISTVEIDLSEDGRINTQFHDSAVVFPGDRIRWTCKEKWRRRGVLITVKDFCRIVDLDLLTDLMQGEALVSLLPEVTEVTPEGHHTWTLPSLASVQAALDPAGAPESTPEDLPAEKILSALAPVFDEKRVDLATGENRELWPFEGDWRPPESPVDPWDPRLTSSAIQKIKGHWIWKFTWVVEFRSGPESQTSDPHIFIHEGPST